MVVIFDLGVGERGLLRDRPEHRLHAAVEAAIHDIAADLAGDRRLGPVGHGGVVIVPVAEHAEALELLALGVDPERGELPAFPAELQDRHRVLVPAAGAVVLLDLPFDRQAVAVPAGDVVGVLARHLPAAVDDVLQDLVERVADMQVAVRIGRAVMEDELVPPARVFALAAEQVLRLPARQDLRFAPCEAGAHREIRLRQEDGVAVILGHSGSPFAGSVKEGSAGLRPPARPQSDRCMRSLRSWSSCAWMESVAIGRASSRPRSIGSSVCSQ